MKSILSYPKETQKKIAKSIVGSGIFEEYDVSKSYNILIANLKDIRNQYKIKNDTISISKIEPVFKPTTAGLSLDIGSDFYVAGWYGDMEIDAYFVPSANISMRYSYNVEFELHYNDDDAEFFTEEFIDENMADFEKLCDNIQEDVNIELARFEDVSMNGFDSKDINSVIEWLAYVENDFGINFDNYL